MSYEAKIVKIDGKNFKVHFSNGSVERLSNLKEYKEFIKDYEKKQKTASKETKSKRSKE